MGTVWKIEERRARLRVMRRELRRLERAIETDDWDGAVMTCLQLEGSLRQVVGMARLLQEEKLTPPTR